jgi:hypothetical protein
VLSLVLSNFLNLPSSCVFLIINKEQKLVYINYTENIASALARFYADWAGKPGAEALELDILSVTTDIETLKLHTEYWKDHYRNNGYGNLISIGRKTLQYEVRALVAADLSCVNVELVTARGQRKVVGKFKTLAQANDFIMTYYAEDNRYRLPIYAVNSLTKEFMLDKRKTAIII